MTDYMTVTVCSANERSDSLIDVFIKLKSVNHSQSIAFSLRICFGQRFRKCSFLSICMLTLHLLVSKNVCQPRSKKPKENRGEGTAQRTVLHSSAHQTALMDVALGGPYHKAKVIWLSGVATSQWNRVY